MPQSAVGLGLERIGELGVSLLVVDERTERTLHPILERDKERVACHGIGAAVKEELNQRSIPSEQNIRQRNRMNAGAVLNEHLDHVQTPGLHRLRKGSVLYFLPWFVAGEQFNEAVEPGIDGGQEWRLLDRR
jgi:hypothetical protein